MITFILLSTLISFFPLNLPSIKHLSPVVHPWETTNKWGKLKRQSYGNKAPPTQNIPGLVSNPQVVLCCALIILKRLENHGKHLLSMTLDTLDHYESDLLDICCRVTERLQCACITGVESCYRFLYVCVLLVGEVTDCHI